MRVAALYDIHGNLPALEAVLEEVRSAEVDEIVIGGDVLPGPMPRATLECLLELEIPARYIRGDGDREVLARIEGIDTDWYRSAQEPSREPVRWSAEQLLDEHQRTLADWPATCSNAIDGLGEVLFCHATPHSDTECFTRLSPEQRLLSLFAAVGARVVVCGHTHMPFERQIGDLRVVNAGSVGMPFGRAGADWLLLGPGVELRHTEYDLASAAERIRQTPYPQARHFAENNVLQPPSEQTMLEAFAKSDLG